MNNKILMVAVVLVSFMLQGCWATSKQFIEELPDGRAQVINIYTDNNLVQSTTVTTVHECDAAVEALKCDRLSSGEANVITSNTDVFDGSGAAALYSYGDIKSARHLSKKGPDSVTNTSISASDIGAEIEATFDVDADADANADAQVQCGGNSDGGSDDCIQPVINN